MKIVLLPVVGNYLCEGTRDHGTQADIYVRVRGPILSTVRSA